MDEPYVPISVPCLQPWTIFLVENNRINNQMWIELVWRQEGWGRGRESNLTRRRGFGS